MIYIFSLISFLFLHSSVTQALEQEEIAPDQGCIWFQGYQSTGFGRARLTFFNACDRSRFVNVCLIDASGKGQLLKGISRVPSGGKIDFTPFLDRSPKSVTWSSAPMTPVIPAPCVDDSRHKR